jgi:hypothetical protein
VHAAYVLILSVIFTEIVATSLDFFLFTSLALPVFAGLVWDALRRFRRDTPDIDMTLNPSLAN